MYGSSRNRSIHESNETTIGTTSLDNIEMIEMASIEQYGLVKAYEEDEREELLYIVLISFTIMDTELRF